MNIVKKNRKIIAMMLLLVVVFTLISTIAFAGGVGNHISNSSSSSSRSSRGRGDSLIVYLIFRLLFSPFGIIFLILYGLGYFLSKKKQTTKPGIYIVKYYEIINNIIGFVRRSSNKSSSTSTKKNIPDNTEEISKAIKKVDPNFSTDRFISWAESVFMRINFAWTKKEWEVIRPFENEHLFSMHSQQLQQYIDTGSTNYIKNIMINQSYLYTYDRDDNYEYIKMVLKSRLISYVLDDETGKLLEGDRNQEVYIDYIMTFMRSNDVKTTPGKSNLSTSKCPNCGAPTEITSSGKCPYCEEVITTGEHDWVLSDFDSVTKDTIIDTTPVTVLTSEKENNNDFVKNKEEDTLKVSEFCSECGSKNDNEVNFCESCGNRIG